MVRARAGVGIFYGRIEGIGRGRLMGREFLFSVILMSDDCFWCLLHIPRVIPCYVSIPFETLDCCRDTAIIVGDVIRTEA